MGKRGQVIIPRICGYIFILLFLSACGGSKNAETTGNYLRLPGVEMDTLFLAVLDLREQVVENGLTPDFIGFRRISDKKTKLLETDTGDPLSVEIAREIYLTCWNRKVVVMSKLLAPGTEKEEALKLFGDPGKLMVLECHRLHLDGMNTYYIAYDIGVSVFGKGGALLANKRFRGKKVFSSNRLSPETVITEGVDKLIGSVLNDADLVAALQTSKQ